MEHMLLAVPDVTCQHCVRAITEFVSAAFLLAVLGVFTLYLGGG